MAKSGDGLACVHAWKGWMGGLVFTDAAGREAEAREGSVISSSLA